MPCCLLYARVWFRGARVTPKCTFPNAGALTNDRVRVIRANTIEVWRAIELVQEFQIAPARYAFGQVHAFSRKVNGHDEP